jgi:triphosphatase
MKPVKAEGSPVKASMGAGAAFNAVGNSSLDHFEANRAGMLAGADPEFLHQGRVALRRLRSSFRIFSPLARGRRAKRLHSDLERLLDALGPARDWDVFLAFTLAPAVAEFPAHRGLAGLARACERKRHLARDAARHAVGSRRARTLVREVREFLAEVPAGPPVRDFACKRLARCDKRMRKRALHLAKLDAEGLHRLRLAVKRLRYATHFFAPLFARRRVEALRDALGEAQDALGSCNDCAVAVRLLHELRGKGKAELVRRTAKKLAGHRLELRSAWKDVEAAERFWE